MIVKKKEGIISRRIAGEMFLVPVSGRLADMRCIYALNAVGEFIWERLDGRRPVEHIEAEIIDSFEVSRDQAKADVTDFIARLLDSNLIEKAA